MNTPPTIVHHVNEDNLSLYEGRSGMTAEMLASAASFVRFNTPDVIALRLAQMKAEEVAHRAALKLINIVTTNDGWVQNADLPGIEWAFGRKITSPGVEGGAK